MDMLWKGLGVCLLTCILMLSVGKQDRDVSVLLGIAGCVGAAFIAMRYLEPVVGFLHRLGEIGSLDSGHMAVVIKAVGVGIITELASVVCSGAGNDGLGKTVQLLGTSVIIWLSIPVFEALLDLISSVLGEI